MQQRLPLKRLGIGGWLRGLGLERYEQAFRENEIDLREARRVEQARLDAAAAAEREEALLAIRRAGRKKKKRNGH